MKGLRNVHFMLVVWLLPCATMQAQTQRMDSLVVLSETQSGKARALTLLHLGFEHMRRGAFDQALAYASLADSVAGVAGDKYGAIEADLLYGRIYDLQGDAATATTYYQNGLQKAVDAADVKMQGKALTFLASNYETQREYDKALVYYEKAITLNRLTGNVEEEIRAVLLKADCLSYIRNFQKSKQAYLEGIRLLAGYHNPRLKSVAYGNYARLLSAVYADYEQAEVYNQLLYATALAEKDTIFMAFASDFKAFILEEKGDYRGAMRALRQSLQFGKHLKDSLRVAENLTELGGVAIDLGDLSSAWRYIDSVSTYYFPKKDSSIMAFLLSSYGLASAHADDAEGALAYFRRAERLERRAADQSQYWAIASELVNAFEQNGMLDSALSLNGRLLALNRESFRATQRLRMQRACLMLKTGAIDSARHLASEVSMAIGRGRGLYFYSNESQPQHKTLMGTYHRVVGEIEMAAGDYGKAVGHFSKAMATANFWNRLEIHEYLYTCYTRLGDRDRQLHALQRWTALKDSAFHSAAELQRHLALTKFRTLEKEQENVRLHAEKGEQFIQIRYQQRIIALATLGILLLGATLLFAWRAKREAAGQKRKVVEAYRALQNTEVQLIQSEKLAGLGQMVAGIAHEINNPLNFIINGLEGIRTSVAGIPLSETLAPSIIEIKSLSRSVHRGAERLKKIVDGLLKISHGAGEVVVKSDLLENMELALMLIQTTIHSRDIAINVHADSVPVVECNAGEINQAFVNILTNAVQAIRGNGAIDIMIAEHAGSDSVEVTIRDTGIGIPEHQLAKVYDPFFTTKPVGEGTGLGLTITWKIVKRHRGTLRIASRLGEGTTVSIILPKKQPFYGALEMRDESAAVVQ